MKKQTSTEQFVSQQTHLSGPTDTNSIPPVSADFVEDVTDTTTESDLSESGVTRRDGRCRKILDIIG